MNVRVVRVTEPLGAYARAGVDPAEQRAVLLQRGHQRGGARARPTQAVLHLHPQHAASAGVYMLLNPNTSGP